MARFCGIKQLAKKLPTLVLYMIYQYYAAKIAAAAKELALKKMEQFKKFGGFVFEPRNSFISCRHFRLDLPRNNRFEIVYSGMIHSCGPWLWIELKYCFLTKVVTVCYTNLYDNHPLRFKKRWKEMLSTAVCLLDQFHSEHNPQEIKLQVFKSSSYSHYGHIKHQRASLRFVDAVREAANNKVIEYELKEVVA